MTLPVVVLPGLLYFFFLSDQRVQNKKEKKKKVPYQEVGLALGNQASLKAEKAVLITN